MSGGGRFSVLFDTKATGFDSVEAHGRLMMTKVEEIGVALKIASEEYAALIEEQFKIGDSTWAPESEWSISDRSKFSNITPESPILRRSGALYTAAVGGMFTAAQAITPQTRNYMYSVVARGKNGANYAAVMQHGGYSVLANAPIPARPFIPSAAQMTLVLKRATEGYLMAGAKGYSSGVSNYSILGSGGKPYVGVGSIYR